MNRYFVGVDLGATSGRVILATLCGEGIALEVLHRFPNRLLSIGGKYSAVCADSAARWRVAKLCRSTIA